MTVGELIERLQALDPGLPAWLDCGDPYDVGAVIEVTVEHGDPHERIAVLHA